MEKPRSALLPVFVAIAHSLPPSTESERNSVPQSIAFEARRTRAHLEGAHLSYTHLENARLSQSALYAADLRGASLNVQSRLTKVLLDRQVRVADVIWDDIPLTRVQWEPPALLTVAPVYPRALLV